MTRREFALIAVMFALVSLWSIAFQPQNNYAGYDGTFYVTSAQQIAQGQPPTGPLPWIYRMGTPFVAAVMTPLTGDLITSFKLFNLVASALTTLLLALYLRRHVGSMSARLIVMFLFLTQWHAPVRFVYFYPTSVDFWLMVFILVALLLSDEIRCAEETGAGERRALFIGLLSLLIFVGILFREIVAVFALTALFISNPLRFSHNPTYLRQIKLPNVNYFVPLLAALGGWLMVNALVVINQEGYPYTFTGTVYLWLYDKRLLSYLLAWFVAFGPVLMLVAYNWRRASAWLAGRQDVILFVLALVALAWVGGTDTERFLYWGMPVFYVLLGRAIDDHAAWLRKSPILLLALIVTQLLSQRFLLSTPDFNALAEPQLTPLLTVLGTDTSFEHLHTFYSTLRWQDLSFALTVEYLVLAAVLLVWMSTRAGQASSDE
jgi:hypothetical protein